MSVPTKAEIKVLLRITNTNYDNFIDTVIPLIVLGIIEDCNNNFTTGVVVEDTTISFTNSGKYIEDSGDGFDEFKAGMLIYIAGSLYNEGYQLISGATDAKITLDATVYNDLIDEDAGALVQINRAIFPDRLKVTIANMIQWQIKKFANFETNDANEQSFSVTIQDYPQSILNELSSYRRIELL